MSTGEKFTQMLIAIGIFFGVVAVILLLTQRLRSRRGELVQSAAFVLPAVILLAVGLLYPAIVTIYQSFKGPNGQEFVGIDNYHQIFTDGALIRVLVNTALWVILVPLVSTAIGLIYAILIDRAKFEKFAKALIFLPMAISLVGASIIWRFVYDYRDSEREQIGIANEILKFFGFDTYRFLLNEPWNTFFLIVIMIWVQAGFAMTILSASIKAIPDDIVEAARLDGVGGFKMFRFITVPSIRPSLIVVLTTISITTLKAFDIVRTTTGGNFDTSVLAYEFYFQSFRAFNQGLGAAIGVLIFVLVLPIVIYNVRQMRKLEAPMSTAITDVEATVAQQETLSSNAHKTLTSPWASLAAIVIAVLWTVPTLGLFVTSFRPESEVTSSGWWTILKNPGFTLDNYREVLTGSTTDFSTYFINTIVITIPAVLIPVSLATMAAYAFAWMKFPGRDFLFVAVFALQIVPIQITMIPLQSLYVRAGLAGSDAPGGGFYTIWLSHSIFALPLAIYLLHNFMRQIPGELIESARVDGAGHVQIFSRIMLPLMAPAIAAFAIFQFLWVWNDLLVALVFSGGSLQVSPLTVRLAELSGTRGQDWYLLSAGAFVSLVVPLIVFLSLQRYFVRGLMAGSVKG